MHGSSFGANNLQVMRRCVTCGVWMHGSFQLWCQRLAGDTVIGFQSQWQPTARKRSVDLDQWRQQLKQFRKHLRILSLMTVCMFVCWAVLVLLDVECVQDVGLYALRGTAFGSGLGRQIRC